MSRLFGVLILQNQQPGNLVAIDRDVVVEEKRIGKVGLVIVAVYLGGDNGLAIAYCGGGDFEGDIGADYLAVAPFLDCDGAVEITPDVRDECVIGEASEESVGIMVVGRLDVRDNGFG